MDTTIFLTNCLEQHKQKKGGKESFLQGIMMGSFMAFFVHHHLIYMARQIVCVTNMLAQKIASQKSLRVKNHGLS